ncbi:MAG: tetratricopeptide repeat protein [Anaerolineae bacterium]
MRKQLSSRITAVIICVFILLVARADPLPQGAIKMLWQAAEELYTLKSYGGAIQAYEQVATLLPTEPAPLVAIGYIYLAQHRWLLALDAFNRALARRIDDATAWAGLASVNWAQGEMDTAATHWQAALHRQPDLMSARLGLALTLLHKGQTEEANATLKTGLAALHSDILSQSNQPNEIAAAHLLRGAILTLDAPAEARYELSLIPEDALLEIRSQRDHLLAALDRVTALRSPALAAKHIGLAMMEIELWPLAHLALTRACTLQPDDAEAVASLGRVEAMMGLDRSAWEHLSTAAILRPEWSRVRLWLGAYCRHKGLLHLAVMQLRTAVALEPTNTEALLELSRAYMDQGSYTQAEETLLTATTKAPHNLDIQLALARFYADRLWRVADRGLVAAQKAAQMAPQNASARDLLGWMYLLAGDLRQARLHLLSALTLDPEQASTYYHLGRYYLILGLRDHARSAFSRVVDLDRTGELRARALDLLSMLNQSDGTDGDDFP